MNAVGARQEIIQSAAPRARSPFRQGLHRLFQRRLAVIGLLFVSLVLAVALLAPLVATHDPTLPDFNALLESPGTAHLLGTDELGRDVFSRVIYGARLSLLVGLVSVTLAVAAGVPIGLISGYVGGLVDEVVMRIMDSLLALPSLVLTLTIAAVLGASFRNVVFAIAIVAIPGYTRLIRGQVLSAKQNDYVLAARALGAGAPPILLRHVLPNTISPIIVQASLGVGYAIITEAALSFLGLGVQPPTPSWGRMVQTGFAYLEIAPWLVLAPATMIFLAVLGFNLLGDGLRDALDPSMRTS